MWKIIGYGLWGACMFAINTSPNDAQSNFSEWLELLGVRNLPIIITSESFDVYMELALIALAVLYLSYVLINRLKNKKNIYFTPLNKALENAWNKLEGTPLINGLQCLDLGETWGDKRMHWLWREFIDKDKFDIDIYGAREPSENIRKIDKNLIKRDVSNTYNFDDNKIRVENSTHFFKNVTVKNKDLKRFIKKYKNDKK